MGTLMHEKAGLEDGWMDGHIDVCMDELIMLDLV